MFRGYLQTRLIGWLGTWQGWVSASLVHAFVHVPQRMWIQEISFAEALERSAMLIPISLYMGFVMIRTRNLVGVGLLHTFANFMGELK